MSQSKTPKEKPLDQLGYKRIENDRAWDWINDVSSNIRNYLRSPAVIIPFLKDKRLKESLTRNNKIDHMNDLVRRLGEDTRNYTENFQIIYNKHSDRSGSSKDQDDLFYSIAIGQDYIQFMNSYETVVLTTMEEIIELFEEAGLDTTTIKPMADGSLVYDLYNNKG